MLQINGVLLISEGEILKSFWSFDVMPSSVIPERTTDLKKKTKENKSDILTESCNLETSGWKSQMTENATLDGSQRKLLKIA